MPLDQDQTPGRLRFAARSFARFALIAAGALAVWQAVVTITGAPRFILPPPGDVLATLIERADYLARHGAITLTEIVLGLILGVSLGAATAILAASRPGWRRWLMPVLTATQALPVFAIAPLLVLWFGFGLASKLVMTALIVFFPVASTLFDGLSQTDRGLVDLARLSGASRARALGLIRLPSALPAFGSGLRVAAALAPIGAIVGEWVGAAGGLGFVMIQAQARGQIDTVFAALFILVVLAVALRALANHVAARLSPWAADTTLPSSN